MPFFLLALAIIALTATGAVHEWNHQRDKEVARLGAVADLKARQIADWLDERQRTAKHIQISLFLSERYLRWRAGDAASGKELHRRLDDFIRDRTVKAIDLLDPDGKRLWHSRETPKELAPVVLAAAANRTREIQRIGPFSTPDGAVHLEFVVPLGETGAVLVLHAGLDDWLYNALQSWPVPSDSGESLLFRRDGDEVVYLNELRHRKGSALKLRLPLASPDLPAARLLRGEVREGEVQTGLDYRGVRVVGIARPVAGTDWYLAAKVDTAEINAPAIHNAWRTGLIGLLALLVAGAGMVLLRQREQLAAGEALRRSEEQLHALAARLEAVREEERTRVAREVHDVLGQLLTGLTLELAWLDKRVGRVAEPELRQAMAAKVAELAQLADSMIWSVQRIASELRPSALDDLDLGAAIRFEMERFGNRTGIAGTVEMPAEVPPLTIEKATAIFRIFQEILSNIARHAGARQVEARLEETADGLLLEVRDDGRGITPEQLADAGSLGLLGMRERAERIGARLAIHGEPDKGTTVRLEVSTG